MNQINKTNKTSKTVIPRNFLLYDSLEKIGNYTHVTYGLADEDTDPSFKNNYVKMEYWNCTIMYDDGDALNIFEVRCRCTKKYPEERPILTFLGESMQHKRIKKICNTDGTLKADTINLIKWDQSMSLGDYLNAALNVISNY